MWPRRMRDDAVLGRALPLDRGLGPMQHGNIYRYGIHSTRGTLPACSKQQAMHQIKQLVIMILFQSDCNKCTLTILIVTRDNEDAKRKSIKTKNS